MAEDLLHHIGKTDFDVASSGSQPCQLHPDAIAARAEKGIDIHNQQLN